MTEYPELFEKIDILERLVDVQVELTEKLFDRVAFLEENVLQLERTRAVKRSKIKKDGVPPPVPSKPSEGECDARSAC